MHIGMNMMSTAAISAMLEKRLGTLKQTFTMAWAMLLTSTIYTMVALFLHLVLRKDGLMYQHSVGFSGVIFHLSVMECNLLPNQLRSVFGFLSVPAYLYPWALLMVLQVIMPNLSLVGHLAGIMSGTLQSYGILDFLFVSDAYLQEMERWNSLRLLTSQPSFVATPVSLETGPRDSGSLQRALGNGIRVATTFLKNVLETLFVCIFGRGSDANDNIQLGLPFTMPTADNTIEFDEEDDWVGLPPMPGSADRDIESRIV